MPSDPELVAETQAWLAKAREDLAVAEYDLTAQPPFLAASVFHVQQAVEKEFKAFLTWHARPFRRTHSLEELGEQCLSVDDSLRATVDSVARLTKYAWEFRYPGDPAEPTREEVDQAMLLARNAYDAILERPPAEVRP